MWAYAWYESVMPAEECMHTVLYISSLWHLWCVLTQNIPSDYFSGSAAETAEGKNNTSPWPASPFQEVKQHYYLRTAAAASRGKKNICILIRHRHFIILPKNNPSKQFTTKRGNFSAHQPVDKINWQLKLKKHFSVINSWTSCLTK